MSANPIMEIEMQDKVVQYLKNRDLCYASIFSLCIQTGIPLCNILTMQVKDIPDSEYFNVPKIKENGKGYIAILSPDLFYDLQTLTKHKNPDDYVFASFRDKHKPVPHSTFRVLLSDIENVFHLENFSGRSLTKTFFYNIFALHGINEVKNLLGYASAKLAYEYLGIEPPLHKHEQFNINDNTIQQIYSAKTNLSKIVESMPLLSEEQKDIVNKLLQQTNNTLSLILTGL